MHYYCIITADNRLHHLHIPKTIDTIPMVSLKISTSLLCAYCSQHQGDTHGGIRVFILPKLPCSAPQRDSPTSMTSSQLDKYITWVKFIPMKSWVHHWSPWYSHGLPSPVYVAGFHRPDTIPVAQQTVPKHSREPKELTTHHSLAIRIRRYGDDALYKSTFYITLHYNTFLRSCFLPVPASGMLLWSTLTEKFITGSMGCACLCVCELAPHTSVIHFHYNTVQNP